MNLIEVDLQKESPRAHEPLEVMLPSGAVVRINHESQLGLLQILMRQLSLNPKALAMLMDCIHYNLCIPLWLISTIYLSPCGSSPCVPLRPLAVSNQNFSSATDRFYPQWLHRILHQTSDPLQESR